MELTKFDETSNRMDVAIWGELAVWFKENVFDETEPSSELELAVAAEEAEQIEAGGLSDNARLYHWCPRRKRLVRSN